MWPRVRDQRIFLGVMAGLIGLAWISLWMWKQSPYGRFLSHHENESVLGHDSNYALVVVLFAAGWTLMTIAMMLPTSLSLVALFRSFVRRRPRPRRLVLLLVLGYLSVWTLFAGAVHMMDLWIHETVDRVGWLGAHAWIISAATILLAGVYQFTPLKYACLDQCRSPMSFILQHWHGDREGLQAFRLGAHHGLFCLGCCWSLMLVMFAVGAGNIGWMLLLGAVMAVEKNAPWGRRLAAPLGATLVAWGAVLIVLGIPGPGGVQ